MPLAKIDELDRFTDADQLWDAARRARIELGFRRSDPMIGLRPVPAEVLDQLKHSIDRAVERAAALGHPDAQADLAGTIYFGRQQQRAAEAFQLVTAAGTTRATYLRGLFRLVGFGCPVDKEQSRADHLAAAGQGDADAMFELYVYFAQGIGGDRDDTTARAWCEKAAHAGSPRAMANLGGFYATGDGVPKDSAEAIHWYERAAEAGSGRAAAILGIMHALGDGIPVDDAEARKWLELAEDLGHN